MHPIAVRAQEGDEPITTLVSEFYGEEGPLVAAGWEIRESQRAMSLEIAQAYDAHAEASAPVDGKRARLAPPRWVLSEAPTGTGKSLAYLVPGLLITLRAQEQWKQEDKETRKPNPPQLVVSTANIALQEQILRKDIPAVGKMLGFEPVATLLKGRNNYLCRREVATLGGMDDEGFDRLMREVEGGWDGDRESLAWDPGKLWGKVSRMSDECTGQGCPHYSLTQTSEEQGDGIPSPCFWRKAVAGWNKGHVSILNHHMLALQKSLNACLLAVDEMHELEGAVRSSVSVKLTRGSGSSLAKRAAKWIGSDEAEDLIRIPVNSIMDALTDAFREENRRPSRWPKPAVLKPGWNKWLTENGGVWARILAGYEEVTVVARQHGCFEMGTGNWLPPRSKGGEEGDGAKLAPLASALYRLAQKVQAFALGEHHPDWPGDPWAMFVDGFWRNGDPIVVGRAVPADVSWAVQKLQGRYPVTAMTSATVPEFRSLRLTFGMPTEGDKADGKTRGWSSEKRLPSPYDLASMGVLVVPDGPSPKDKAAWQPWASDTVVEAVQASRGGALILASSIGQMKAYAEALRGWIDTPVKAQGEEGRATLRQWFHDNEDATLVATRSFFQGLDVKGNSLRLVVIDRIPFQPPGDPIEEAVMKLLVDRNGGGSGYSLRAVPLAAMTMAQGGGRLIRSQDDRGVLLVLDKRVMGASGGWRVIREALPGFPLSRHLGDITNLLEGKPLVGIPKVKARTSGIRWS